MARDIGFIGLGRMGTPMARRLAAAGYSLHVYDKSPAAIENLARDTKCDFANDLPDLGAASDVVITVLPDGNAVHDVLLGAHGVTAGLRPGSFLIDMTSASPIATRKLGGELAALGFPLVDAPVSGGVKRAADGTLAIMAGGLPDVVAKARPILDILGTVFETGGPGTGHAMKAMNNYLSAGTLALTAEAVLAGTHFGLDPQVMINILNASTGRSNATEQKYPTFVLPRTFDSGFFLGLMAKDLRLALDVSRAVETPNDLLTALSRIYDRAESELGFGADNTEVVKYLEALAEDHGDDLGA